jgi:CDP-glucose 4,6-dehydratase
MADERRGADFWHGKRVLITGHTGFIGSWLSYWLVQRGAKVAGYALAPHTTPSLYEALELDTLVDSTIADICDRAALKQTFLTHQPEIVIHLAAQAIVGRAHVDAYETWRVNVLGTVALLEAVHAYGKLQSLCLFTTDKVYDNHEDGRAYAETNAIGGFGSYDCSKASAELAARAFMHGGMVPLGTATIRAGNVIGGGDWNEARLVPDCARAFASGTPVTLRHPNSIRPWQHVLELCHATLLLAQMLYESPNDYRGAWNIGPDETNAASAAAVAEQLASHWAQTPPWQPASGVSSFPEATTLLLSSAKLKEKLHWHPVLPLAEALSWTSDWYRAWQHDASQAAAITKAQLETFEQMASA